MTTFSLLAVVAPISWPWFILWKRFRKYALGGAFLKCHASICGRLVIVLLLDCLSDGGRCGMKIGDRVGVPS